MTGARRQQKAKLGCTVAAAAAAMLVAVVTGGHLPAGAATTTLIVTDSLTGLALSGFDPVAYFTDHRPQLGKGDHELTYGGVIWRFHNDGNRAAFIRNPDVYAPRFGGYDPVALARGVAIAGHPLIWLISADRLYLFSELDNRNSFAADPGRSVGAAEHRWDAVKRTLVP